MQLKLQRSQRAGGLVGNTIFFCLDVRADYSSEEQSNIRRYKLGPQLIYSSRAAQKHAEQAGAQLDRTQQGTTGERVTGLARGVYALALAKMSLNISIASLGKGHHIECKDIEELLEAEDTVRTACKNVTRYLEVAQTFDGSEVVIEYEKGEERVHIAQHAPAWLAYDGPPDTAAPDAELQSPYLQRQRSAANNAGPTPSPLAESLEDMAREFRRLGTMFKNRWLAVEARIMAMAAKKNFNCTPLQVRIVSGLAALGVLVVLWQIF